MALLKANTGIGITNPSAALHVLGDGIFVGVVSATTFYGNLGGGVQGSLPYQSAVNSTTFLSPGTAGQVLITNGLGQNPYWADVSSASGSFGGITISDEGVTPIGTASSITSINFVGPNVVATASGTGATITLSNDAQYLTGTAPGSVISQSSGLTITGNLYVSGNIGAGGSSVIFDVGRVNIKDKDLVLGITTNALDRDISTDNTANHGGIAIASTEGSPLFNINAGFGTDDIPSTYKQIMWLKSGTFTGLNTDAWLFNYAVGVGTDQVPNGVRLAVGNVQFTQNDLVSVRNINSSGIISATQFVGSLLGNVTSADYAKVAGIATYATSSGIATYAGYSTTAGIATYATNAGISTYATSSGIATYATNAGISTNLKGGLAGNIPYQSAPDTTTFLANGTSGKILQSNGVGNAPTWVSAADAGAITGVTILDEGTTVGTSNSVSSLNFVGGNIVATASGVGATITIANNLVGTALSISGISTFTNGPVLIGSGTSTGTASQRLQVTGGGYFSSSVGIGNSVPDQALTVQGLISLKTSGGTTRGLIGCPSWDDSYFSFQNGSLSQSAANSAINQSSLGDTIVNAASGRFVALRVGNGEVARIDSGNFLINSTSATGTASQRLQVTGGAAFTGVGASVGIGTTNPTQSLHVQGNLRVTGVFRDSTDLPGTSGQILQSTNTGTQWINASTTNVGSANSIAINADSTDASRYLTFVSTTSGNNLVYVDSDLLYNSSTNSLVINSTSFTGTASQNLQVTGGAYVSGNLGIGITRPTSKLQVVGDVLVSGVVTATSFIGTATTAINVIGGIGSITQLQVTGISTFTNGPVFIGAATSTGTASQRLQVTGGAYVSGNTGIGTTNPLQPLQVGFGTNIVVVDNTGELGIGVTNPLQKLHVLGNVLVAAGSATTQHITQRAYELNNGTLSWEASAGQLFSITNNLTSGSIFSVNDVSGIPSIDVDANGTVSLVAYSGNVAIGSTGLTGTSNQKLQVTGGGYVSGSLGIGTTNPSQSLHVQGNARLTGALYDGSNLAGSSGQILSSTGSAISWINASTTNVGSANSIAITADSTNASRYLTFVATTSGNNVVYVNSSLLYNPSTGDASVNGLTIGRGTGSVSSNTALGYQTLLSNTTGNQNIATGYQALYSNTIGIRNTATGHQAIYSNTTGNDNTATGYTALAANTTGINNTATGFESLRSNTIGSQNTATGYQALYANTTGQQNTANGVNALRFNTTGTKNTATGHSALYSNTTASNNTANGYKALNANTTGTDNTATGTNALLSNTTGSSNTATGLHTLYFNTTGTNNTATGVRSLLSNTTGVNNTADGFNALYDNTTGTNNTAIGYLALRNNTIGTNNTATGYQALNANTTGGNNVANGVNALNANTTGTNNTANGYYTLFSNTTGTFNTATGVSALRANTTGTTNTANGSGALTNNTTGGANTATGLNALYFNTTGIQNTATGVRSLLSNTTGTNNTANGYRALYSNTIGTQNTANGTYTLYSNTTGNANTATGYAALYNNTTGTFNTAIGYGALYNTTGTQNTATGLNAGSNITTGSNNSFLGYDAQPSSATVSNEITLGDANVDTLRVPGLGFYGVRTNTTVATTSITTIDSITVATYRSARIQIQITQGSNYQVSDVLLIHDGTTASIIEYGTLATGSTLGTYSATISGGNALLQVTMGSATSSAVKVLSYRTVV